MTLHPARVRRSTIHSLRSSRPLRNRPRISIKCFCRRHRAIDRSSRATTSVPLSAQDAAVGQLVQAPPAALASTASRLPKWAVPGVSIAPPAVVRPADVSAMGTHGVCSMPSSIGEFR